MIIYVRVNLKSISYEMNVHNYFFEIGSRNRYAYFLWGLVVSYRSCRKYIRYSAHSLYAAKETK